MLNRHLAFFPAALELYGGPHARHILCHWVALALTCNFSGTLNVFSKVDVPSYSCPSNECGTWLICIPVGACYCHYCDLAIQVGTKWQLIKSCYPIAILCLTSAVFENYP